MRSNHPNNEAAFTLIELLVVIAIIGILAAIAIPEFSSYKTRAYDARAEADLHNAITAQEGNFIDYGEYNMCTNDGCNHPALAGFRKSQDVAITCAQIDDGRYFQCQTQHPNGSKSFYYNSMASAFWTMPLR